MSHISYGELRPNLARTMDKAIENRGAILVTRQGGTGNVMLISEDEFHSWQETVHLLASPPTPRGCCAPSRPRRPVAPPNMP